MQIDIAESIRETLAELNPVGLYGIGTLSLVHNPASFGEQRKSLKAPTMSLHFSESNSSNTLLFKWLQEKYDISKSDAEKSFKIFCEKLLNGLVNYGKVNIKGIASFRQNDELALSCTPDKDFVNLFYKGLPEIPISHIDRRDLKDPALSTVASPIVLDEPDSIVESNPEVDSHTEIIPIRDGSASEETDYEETFEITRKDFIVDDEAAIEIKPIVQDNTKVVAQMDSNVASSLKEGSVDTFDATATWDPQPINTNHDADSIFNGRNIALLLGLLLLLILGYFGCQKFFNSSSDDAISPVDPVEANHVAMTHADSISNGLIAESFTFKGVPLPEKCIIVTGVFKKSRNAIRMQDLLLSKGYDVFQSVENGLTRVGFRFECREVDLEGYLQNVRRSISKKAWYLDPSLYVEYEL